MKTLKLGDSIIRVEDKKVNGYIKMGYEYVPKSTWKETRKESKEKENDNPKRKSKKK